MPRSSLPARPPEGSRVDIFLRTPALHLFYSSLRWGSLGYSGLLLWVPVQRLKTTDVTGLVEFRKKHGVKNAAIDCLQCVVLLNSDLLINMGLALLGLPRFERFRKALPSFDAPFCHALVFIDQTKSVPGVIVRTSVLSWSKPLIKLLKFKSRSCRSSCIYKWSIVGLSNIMI